MVEQLRELRDRHGYAVSAVVSGHEGTLVDRLRVENIPYFAWDFRFSAPSELLQMPARVLGLAKLFRRERFDIVQTHLFRSMVIGRLAAWIADVPVRLSMVAGPFHLEAPTPCWIDKTCCWMDSRLIGSCELTLDLYRRMGIPNHRLALVYYGPDERKFDPTTDPPADIRRELGWPETTPVIGMVAYFYAALRANRWTPRALYGKSVKAHEDLIRAVPLVLREFPTARFLLVGSGWEEGGRRRMAEMQALVRELHLEDVVIFTGFRKDVNRVLASLDVSVQASYNENLGGTIESLLMARPTVATRVGGMVDSVRDGITGVLVTPADPAELAEGILGLLRDPEHAGRLGQAGRRLMLARFTLGQTVNDLDALYRQLLWRRGRRVAGYRPLVSLWRLLCSGPICVYMSLRLIIADTWLLVALDNHRRPRRLDTQPVPAPISDPVLFNWIYATVGRLPTGFGPRARGQRFLARITSVVQGRARKARARTE